MDRTRGKILFGFRFFSFFRMGREKNADKAFSLFLLSSFSNCSCSCDPFFNCLFIIKNFTRVVRCELLNIQVQQANCILYERMSQSLKENLSFFFLLNERGNLRDLVCVFEWRKIERTDEGKKGEMGVITKINIKRMTWWFFMGEY